MTVWQYLTVDNESKSIPPQQSLCGLTAWASLLAPVVTLAIYAVYFQFRDSQVNATPLEYVWAIFINAIGLACGITSALKWREHACAKTVWIAAFGILGSGAVGSLALFGCALAASFGRNC